MMKEFCDVLVVETVRLTRLYTAKRSGELDINRPL